MPICKFIQFFQHRKEDAETIFRDAGDLNLTTGSEFVWLVTEEAMKANNLPIGKELVF